MAGMSSKDFSFLMQQYQASNHAQPQVKLKPWTVTLLWDRWPSDFQHSGCHLRNFGFSKWRLTLIAEHQRSPLTVRSLIMCFKLSRILFWSMSSTSLRMWETTGKPTSRQPWSRYMADLRPRRRRNCCLCLPSRAVLEIATLLNSQLMMKIWILSGWSYGALERAFFLN